MKQSITWKRLLPLLAVVLLAVPLAHQAVAQSSYSAFGASPFSLVNAEPTQTPCGAGCKGDLPQYIGTATMLADGTILLHLRSSESGTIGEAQMEVKPTDPRYDSIKEHIGPLKPGQVVSVRPWE